MSKTQEAIFPDGSYAQFEDGRLGFAAGDLAIIRLRLITARAALKVWLRQADEGTSPEHRWQLTRNGHRLAVLNVIEPLSGEKFSSPTGRCSDKACIRALAACEEMITALEESAVVYEDES